jgi:hypothetical protein
MTNQYDPILKKGTANQDRNLRSSLWLLKCHSKISTPVVLGLRQGTSSPKTMGLLTVSHQIYSTVLLVSFYLFSFTIHRISLMPGLSTGKSELWNAKSVTAVLHHPFYYRHIMQCETHTAVSCVHREVTVCAKCTVLGKVCSLAIPSQSMCNGNVTKSFANISHLRSGIWNKIYTKV